MLSCYIKSTIKTCTKLAVNYSTVNVQSANKRLKSWKEIPGLKSLPIIKQAYHFIPGIGKLAKLDALEVGKYFHDNFGPIMRLDSMFGSDPLLFLFDVDSIEYVLRSENSTPIRPGFLSLYYFRKKHGREVEETRPTGLLTDNGDNWKTLRSTVNPVMLQPKTIKLYQSVLEDVATDMIQRMKSIRNDRNMIDEFNLEINKWSLESIGTVALGGRIGCLDPYLPKDSEARQLIEVVAQVMDMSLKLDFRPSLWRYFPTRNFKKAMNVYKKQDDLAKAFIDRARKRFTESKRNDEEKGVLEKLIEIDERTALIMATEMLLAGVDTASAAVIGAMFLLGSNPDKQHKLRTELKSNPEKKPYLKACLKETHRMMPVIAGTMRQTTKEYEILGYSIPKGMNITFGNQYLSMIDEQYPRAREYIPERWLVDKSDPLYYGNAHAFATNPFGFGTRMCIGRRIAELELEVFLSKMVENFEIEWFGPPPRVITSSINYIQPPFNFVFKDI